VIHNSAIISKTAEIGENVDIGPYVVIADNVKIGNNVKIAAHAVIKSNTIVGDRCFIDNFAVIGGLPQDKNFDENINSGVKIGNEVVIRENVTIHRATQESMYTTIGSRCMLQSGSHVAHDCVVMDDTVLANCSMLGGHSIIGNHCFIGGGAAVHQWVRVGDYAILGGYSATALDLPPYVMSADRTKIIGLNIVGLRRANISTKNISNLKKCFMEFYSRTGFAKDRAIKMLSEGYGSCKESKHFLEFFTSGTHRGFAPLRRKICTNSID